MKTTMKLQVFLTFLIICDWANCFIFEEPIVEISNGKLSGEFGFNGNGDGIYQFKGIRYGKFSKRFAESEEILDKWEVPQKATEFGPSCRQMNPITFQMEGEENCLFLNVYSRNISSMAKLPVIFFIPGGGLKEYSSQEFQPTYLMNENLVVVTINYRLGPLGFMNVGIKECSGNMGLKDQVLALKWVQKNIQNFGGDPNSVTIYGETAGAASVGFLILSSAARGLFSKAIMQSGSSYGSFYYTKNPLDEAKKLARKFDCPTSNLEYMVECLGRIESDLLFPAMGMFDDFQVEYDRSIEPIRFPVSKETYISSNAFLTLDQIFAQNEQAQVPLLMGINKYGDEFFDPMVILGSQENLDKFNREWPYLFSKLFIFKNEALDRCGLVEQIWDAYFPTKKQITGIEDLVQLVNLFTHRRRLPGFRRFAKFYSQNNQSAVYLYRFTLQGDNTFYIGKRPEGTILSDPYLMDDLPYFFEMPYLFPNVNKTDRFLRDSGRLVSLWASFARNGKPTQLWGNGLKIWPTFNPEKPTWVQIDENFEEIPEEEIFDNLVKFWDRFYEEIY